MNLDERLLEKLIKRIEDEDLKKSLRLYCLLIKCIRLGLVGLVYPQSYIMINEEEKPIPFNISNINSLMEKLEERHKVKDYSVKPIVNGEDKIVEYPMGASIWSPIVKAVTTIFNKLFGKTTSESIGFEKFKSEIIGVYKQRGLIDKYYLISDELGTLIDCVKECVERGLLGENGRISGEILFKVWSEKKKVSMAEEEKSEKPSLRNFIAHAGLSFKVIEYVKVEYKNKGEIDIKQIAYKHKQLNELLGDLLNIEVNEAGEVIKRRRTRKY